MYACSGVSMLLGVYRYGRIADDLVLVIESAVATF
jgi:hypothetical protein